MHHMVLLAHRVVWPDRSLVIDTAMGPAAAKKLPGSKIDGGASERVQAAMKTASAIVFTHEHPDHVGGVASAPDVAAIAKQVRITRDQLDSPKLERKDFSPARSTACIRSTIRGSSPWRPGWCYRRPPATARARSSCTWSSRTASVLVRGRHRLVPRQHHPPEGTPAHRDPVDHEDRPAVAAQVRALAQLPPDVHVIVAHDPVALANDLKAGLYRQGFSGS